MTLWKGNSIDAYKDAFNYYFSLQRQVIERAFGMLKQRWGLLWRPLRVGMGKIPLILTVLCKLHNRCIDLKYKDNDNLVDNYWYDWQDGDNREVEMFRPPGRAGRRTDREVCNNREIITQHFLRTNIVRPSKRRRDFGFPNFQ